MFHVADPEVNLSLFLCYPGKRGSPFRIRGNASEVRVRKPRKKERKKERKKGKSMYVRKI